ncbi:MAG: ribosome small subunit-dependent GTPase A [Defluviitaleaceae bacterium]|nr:ribosome small subunit-dependent GTPase A [Defluviitaleaceae bacterium]
MCKNVGAAFCRLALMKGLVNITGRISGVYGHVYKVILGNNEEANCKVSGSFVGRAKKDMPAVGDFVALDENRNIVQVLPRKNEIMRKASGKKIEEQMLAANVDYAFIVTSMNNDFNPRRIERYIAFLDIQDICWYLVLTKADLCADEELRRYQTEALALADEDNIIITSAVNGDGINKIAAMMTAGKTAVFIGSSGVGKSTVINYLMGEELQDTKDIRNDHKGRHTTTHRELFMLPGGGAIIDTPGMREIQLWCGAEEISSFGDIEDLAARCKFRNCGHNTEPGCAVRDAVEQGILPAARLKSYNKLQREAKSAQKLYQKKR